MQIIKNEIRPVGFVTLEMTVEEIQTILGMLDEISYLYARPADKMYGTRREIYETLKELVKNKN